MVSIERLTKYPDVEKRYKYPRANRLEFSLCLAADQDTSTTDAEEELFRRIVSEELSQKIVSEALFKKILFRRLGSEGEISDDSDTPDIPDIPDTPDVPDVPVLQQKKNCFRSTV